MSCLTYPFTYEVSNLKKVLDCLLDYYELKLNRHLKGFLTPDVNKIGGSSVNFLQYNCHANCYISTKVIMMTKVIFAAFFN